MRFKGTLWLGAALLAIALYYFLVDVPGEERQKEEKERAETLLLFDSENVDTLTVSRENDSYTLKRLGQDDWELTSPVSARADKDTAENLLYELGHARYSRVVAEPADDLAAFGLDKPKTTFTVKLKGGEQLALILGDNHPMGQGLYVKTADKNRVLLASLVQEDLDKSLFEARDKSILHFNREDVARVSLRQGEREFALKREGEGWVLEGKGHGKADGDAVDHLLNSVLAARVTEFVAETPDSLAPYGLDPSATELTLEQADGKPALSLRLGGVESGQGVYAQVKGQANVVRLPGTFNDMLSKHPADFLDKTLFAFKEDEIRGLALSDAGSTVELAPEEGDAGRWKITRPKEEPADASTVATLLSDLRQARIGEFVQVSMDNPGAFGLEHPEREFSVLLKGERRWTLAIGNPTADGNNVFAREAGKAQVFVLEASTVNKLFRSLSDLTDKKLLSFKEDDVTRLEIKTPDATFRLSREDDAWQLDEPEKISPLKDFLVKDIFWTLKRLEYTTRLSESAEGRGLDAPALTVTLYGKSIGKTIAVVIVGDAAKEGGRYALVLADARLVTISERFLDEIPHTLQRFKN